MKQKSEEKPEKPPKRKPATKAELQTWLGAHGHKQVALTASFSKSDAKDCIFELHKLKSKKESQ